MHRVAASDSVAFQKMIKQAGQRSEFSSDSGTGQAPGFQLGAPGQHVRAGDRAEYLRAGEPDIPAKVSQSF